MQTVKVKVTEVKTNIAPIDWGISGPKLQLEFTDGYKIMFKAWSGIEEVPYCFFRSSIKFQGMHTGWKINDLNTIWVRSLGWSQLSVPSDLPCYIGNRCTGNETVFFILNELPGT